MRFWQLEVPFAMPALIWNMMMSMSGGWFFVVASESISVGHTTVALPGIGSYIALAIEQKNLTAIGWAIATMLIVILLYDQLLFRPLVAWVDRFRVEQEPGARVPDSWALTMMRRSRLHSGRHRRVFMPPCCWTSRASASAADEPPPPMQRTSRSAALDLLWVSLIVAAVVLGLWHIVAGADREHLAARSAAGLRPGACITMVRVFVLIALASLIWVPIGVWVGMRPRAAADRAADRAVHGGISRESAVPARGLRHRALEAESRHLAEPADDSGHSVVHPVQRDRRRVRHPGGDALRRGRISTSAAGCGGARLRCRRCCRSTSPGAITASGGSWNAAIVAELASWGNTQIERARPRLLYRRGDQRRGLPPIVLGIGTMSLFVVVINRLFWRPLYYYAERKYRLT